MQIAATISGIAAVLLFLICFQLKTRRSIIICNIASRAMYVLQYILLFAFVGAAMDAAALFSSYVAGKRDTGFVRKYRVPILIFVNAVIVGVGLLLYEDIYSIAAIVGVLFETVALWMTREQIIRILSLIAAPVWLLYNAHSGAWGSVIGNVLTVIAILVALFVHRKKSGDGEATDADKI